MPSLRVTKFWWEVSWEPSAHSGRSPGLTPALCTGSMFGWGSDLHSVQGEMELCLLVYVCAWCCICDCFPCVYVCRIGYASTSTHARRRRVWHPPPNPLAQLDLTPISVRHLLMCPQCDMPPTVKERHKSSSFFSFVYPSTSHYQSVTSALRS